MQMYNPAHPGEVLRDAMENVPMSITAFAAHIGVSRVQLSRVLNCRAAVTPELSMKLSEAFGQNQPDFWFKMQNKYDFWQAAHVKRKPVKAINMKLAA